MSVGFIAGVSCGIVLRHALIGSTDVRRVCGGLLGWLSRHPVDRLLPVVTSGQWVWDADRGDFDRQRSTAVPPALHGVFREEPRHLDLRWARSESELDLRHSRFRDAVAELAPAISACTQSHRVSG